MAKAHRLFLDRVSGYADDASAFIRRRKLTRQPFIRVFDAREVGHAFDPADGPGTRLYTAAEELIAAHRAEQ